MQQSLIRFDKLSKSFGDNHVLKEADLSIYKGQVTSIIGKSGVGKSVLLKIIIGLLDYDSGDILFEEKPFSRMSKAEKKAMKQKFSYMFQNTALFDSMTVFDNIALPLVEKHTFSKSEIHQRVSSKLEQLDLQDIDSKYPSQLSGGMKKRVALARALITEPEIVLFDEPTTGLDPIRKNAVHSMIADYQKQFGFTGIVVSHEIPDIFYISHRVAMLNNGNIIFQGKPEEIQRTTDPEIQDFINGSESRHDELTGMAPQPQGQRRFREEMARMKRHRHAFSIILLTMQTMNDIKSSAGHEAYQAAIRHFASRIRKHLRITDICSRYGMDKIMIALPNTETEGAIAVCEKLAQAMQSEKLSDSCLFPGFCFLVTAGIAEAKEEQIIEDVVARALSEQNLFYEFKVC